MIGNLEPEESVMSRGNWLGNLSIALQELHESGAWDKDDELKVCIAGTLKNDKFIVIKPVKEKMVSNPNPELKQQHPYKGEKQ